MSHRELTMTYAVTFVYRGRKFLSQSMGKRALDKSQIHRVCDRFVENSYF